MSVLWCPRGAHRHANDLCQAAVAHAREQGHDIADGLAGGAAGTPADLLHDVAGAHPFGGATGVAPRARGQQREVRDGRALLVARQARGAHALEVHETCARTAGRVDVRMLVDELLEEGVTLFLLDRLLDLGGAKRSQERVQQGLWQLRPLPALRAILFELRLHELRTLFACGLVRGLQRGHAEGELTLQWDLGDSAEVPEEVLEERAVARGLASLQENDAELLFVLDLLQLVLQQLDLQLVPAAPSTVLGVLQLDFLDEGSQEEDLRIISVEIDQVVQLGHAGLVTLLGQPGDQVPKLPKERLRERHHEPSMSYVSSQNTFLAPGAKHPQGRTGSE
mmetsp:Transcript_28566/g.94792  ORF Transcript_28566/g.94792 Transcript_28566/m.94792 type:complete len:337 (+) Transcript_28566:2032-3042(+)